jgi:predicted nucleic acid-binding protein
MRRAVAGHERLRTSTSVLLEVAFVLIRTLKLPKPTAVQALRDLLAIESLVVDGAESFLGALEIFESSPLSIVDALNVVEMRRRGIAEIYSWNRDYDRFADIIRREPSGA